MTTRIAEAIAHTLFEARLTIATHLDIDMKGEQGDMAAILILAHAEICVRLENSQN
jgi:hypothetical protein